LTPLNPNHDPTIRIGSRLKLNYARAARSGPSQTRSGRRRVSVLLNLDRLTGKQNKLKDDSRVFDRGDPYAAPSCASKQVGGNLSETGTPRQVLGARSGPSLARMANRGRPTQGASRCYFQPIRAGGASDMLQRSQGRNT
jgi:hypothetical protein